VVLDNSKLEVVNNTTVSNYNSESVPEQYKFDSAVLK